jgi:hypothetical protein
MKRVRSPRALEATAAADLGAAEAAVAEDMAVATGADAEAMVAEGIVASRQDCL